MMAEILASMLNTWALRITYTDNYLVLDVLAVILFVYLMLGFRWCARELTQTARLFE